MLGDMALQWRLIALVVVLIVAMALVGRCLLRESSPEARSVGAATVGDASEVRPPDEDALLEHYGLSERDLNAEEYLRDPVAPEDLPPGTEERFAETYVDTVGPPVPEGEESRFAFEVEEVLGPRSFAETFGDQRRLDAADGDDADTGGLSADAELQVVTVRGRVRNITQRDCRALVFKASYRGDDGTIHATGEAIVRDVQAQSRRGSRFEVHLTEWPREIGSPRPEGFRLHELRSRWTY